MIKFMYYENTAERIQINEITPLDDYRLRVAFSNGEVRIFDFKPKLEFPVFRPLKNQALFASVKLCHGTAYWPYDWKKEHVANDIDIAPENLYWYGVLEDEITDKPVRREIAAASA